ncbi:hypothetical protein [Rhizobium sp. NPDC092014]|uniref:hypothetical protein n=1 Tax=Rhizobium sp. NPDC092014 TaxID=3364501 RepID=UPI00381CBB83
MLINESAPDQIGSIAIWCLLFAGAILWQLMDEAMFASDFLARMQEDAADLEQSPGWNQKQATPILWIRSAHERARRHHIINVASDSDFAGERIEVGRDLLHREYFSLQPFMADQGEDHVGFENASPGVLEKAVLDHLTAEFGSVFQPGNVRSKERALSLVKLDIRAIFDVQNFIKFFCRRIGRASILHKSESNRNETTQPMF